MPPGPFHWGVVWIVSEPDDTATTFRRTVPVPTPNPFQTVLPGVNVASGGWPSTGQPPWYTSTDQPAVVQDSTSTLGFGGEVIVSRHHLVVAAVMLSACGVKKSSDTALSQFAPGTTGQQPAG